MRRYFRFGALAIGLLAGAAKAAPDVKDTRLVSQPAVSGKNIAFVYAEDLWIANLDGSNPRRLTSDAGVESNPSFSPDGNWIAFSAQYDGNTDVYLLPASGGAPKRLTTHPAADVVRGWEPDGSAILFGSNRQVFTTRHQQLFTVPVAGGMPTQLPIPNAWEASISPDGKKIAYCPHRDVTGQWKNYRGGTHSRVWVYDRATHAVEEIPQPEGRCNDLDPNWYGGKVVFRSDRAGEYNLFVYDPATKAVTQVTQFADFPVLDIAVNGSGILFEQAGYLHRFDTAERKSVRVPVGLVTDLVETRSRFAKGGKYARGAAVSPSGARAAIEFRGEIVTVPAEKGDPRNLTNTVGAHERSPAWSPDGKWVAYFSDASGNYELHLAPQNGKGETRKVKLLGAGYYTNLVFSPDSTKATYSDQADTLYLLDIPTGTVKKIAESPDGRSRGQKNSSWSKDGKWIAFATDTRAKISRVQIYSVAEDKVYPVTDGLTEATEPVFDASGKYLYFAGSTETGLSKHGFMQSSADSQRPKYTLNLVVLRKDVASPFTRESDEEKGEAPIPPATGPTPNAGNGVPPAAPAPGAAAPLAGAAAIKKAPEPVRIDFDGIDQRILALPMPAGNYSSLQAGSPGSLYYLARSEAPGRGAGGPDGGAMLRRYDLEKRKDETIQAGVAGYALTHDTKKMIYSTPAGTWHIVPAGPGAPMGGPAMPGAGPKALNLDAIEVRVDPEQEWRQIFHEAWRINRDFFYDPTMHGADWPAMEKKYEQFLPHLTNSGDLYRVIKWMLSELCVGHSYHTPGERMVERKAVPGGLLGADYEAANGRYRFKKIYGGLNSTEELRSPLTAPGVNVKEGEYLLAVRGVNLAPPAEVYSLFENTAGKGIEITVGPNPDGTGSRTVTVVPLANEYPIRNLDWVEGNLRKVHKATDGKVAYVYVPDTAAMGLTYFKRYFYPQIDKQAVIVDERSNSGGWIADYYIDHLRKPALSRWAPRYGTDWRTPSAAIHGPAVMIIDEGAGSGGDMLPWMFRQLKLGPLVGKRTWGGLVGIGGFPGLMDGGTVTAPNFAIWTKDGYIIENEGVAPDIDVDQKPADVIAGKDPQLDKAIEVILAELAKNPPKPETRPAYPKRTTNPAAK